MEYFFIKPSVDTKETGPEFPQLNFFNQTGRTKESPIIITNMTPHGELPPKDLKFDHFIIKNKRVKLTDIMSSTFCKGFVVSAKFKEVLETCNLDKHSFYPVKIKRSKEWIEDYYYFHSASNCPQFVDFSKSKFCVKNYIGDEKYELENINAQEELIKKKNELQSGELITAKLLYLKSSFPFQLDLFKLNNFNYNMFMSNRLKNKIQENKITGVEIFEARNFLVTSIIE